MLLGFLQVFLALFLGSYVMLSGATCHGTQHRVVTSKMSGNRTDGGSLQTTRLRRSGNPKESGRPQ